MSDQPELKEFPEFPGEPMSKRCDPRRLRRTRANHHHHHHRRRAMKRSTRFLYQTNLGVGVATMRLSE